MQVRVTQMLTDGVESQQQHGILLFRVRLNELQQIAGLVKKNSAANVVETTSPSQLRRYP